MRAREIFEQFERKPGFTLRHLNKLKQHKQKIDKERAVRNKLVSIMYASPESNQQHYEMQKSQLELEKEKLEYLARKLEIETEYKSTLVNMRNAERKRIEKAKCTPKYGRKRKSVGST